LSNYLVDASVYALPMQIQEKTDVEMINLYEEYLENLNRLFEFIDPNTDDRNFRINHFLFCVKDIKLMIDNNLFFDDDIMTKLRKMSLQRKHKIRLDLLEKFFLNEIRTLQWKGGNTKPEKLCSIETYIGIDNITNSKTISCVPDIASGISNVNLVDNLKENIGILAFLNEKVYKCSDITKIITNNQEKECKVNISIQRIKHNFKNLEKQDINISNCTIINSSVRSLRKLEFYSIDDVLKNAKNDFKNTLEYGNNIDESIDEYKKVLAKLRSDRNIDIEKINKFYKEYPIAVYNCLDVLDKLVKYSEFDDKNNSIQSISNNFNDCEKWIKENDICKKCRGYLRVCGYDCSGEKTTSQFDGDTYVIHLKPYSKMTDYKDTKMLGSKYAEKSLRIYFRWDINKIKIGYIGKHLLEG